MHTSAAIPWRLNLLVATSVVLGQLLLVVILPLGLVPHGTAWAWLLVPIVLGTLPHWALIHEAVHGHLLPWRRANDLLGRLLAILFGSPLDVLRFGHLSHHALNARVVERPEFYDPARRSTVRAAMAYFGRILAGLYIVEFASSILSWLPRRLLVPTVRWMFYEGEADAAAMSDRAVRRLLNLQALWRIRADGLLASAVVVTGVCLWSASWPLFASAMLGRAFLVSFMDNAPHYGGELGNPLQGHDMRLPAGAAALILNANLHGTHHRHPELPWTSLPWALARDGATTVGSWLTVPWRQVRGPVAIPQVDGGRT